MILLVFLSKFISEDDGTDTDLWALKNGYISVVPTQADLTHYPSIEPLNKWIFK